MARMERRIKGFTLLFLKHFLQNQTCEKWLPYCVHQGMQAIVGQNTFSDVLVNDIPR
jgi:hypothetical protein